MDLNVRCKWCPPEDWKYCQLDRMRVRSDHGNEHHKMVKILKDAEKTWYNRVCDVRLLICLGLISEAIYFNYR